MADDVEGGVVRGVVCGELDLGRMRLGVGGGLVEMVVGDVEGVERRRVSGGVVDVLGVLEEVGELGLWI